MEDVPLGRCGMHFEYHPRHCCYRETWNDRERCIWHAEVVGSEKSFPELEAQRESYENRELIREVSDSRPVELLHQVQLPRGKNMLFEEMNRCSLFAANFADSTLEMAEFKESRLTTADFSNAELAEADFSNAILYRADLSGANLRGAQLSGADLRKTTLSNIQVDQATRCGRQRMAEKDVRGAEDWAAMARSYHNLKTAFGGQGLVGKARKHYRLEREARGREARANGGVDGYTAYIGSLLSRYMTGYGVGPLRVLLFAGQLFLLATIVYWDAGISNFWYYSAITFIGTPPEPPISPIVKLVVVVESFLGTALTVLLGYVLGNRESF